MKHLLQFATSYNSNLSRTIECLLELRVNKKKRKKIITLSFLILVYTVSNYLLFINTKNENNYLFAFVILIITFTIIFQLGFFNFLIIEFFKKETGSNKLKTLLDSNKVKIELPKIIEKNDINVQQGKVSSIEQVEIIEKNKVEVEIIKNSKLREETILALKAHKFVKLIKPKCTEEILNFLLDNKIIDDKGKWISEKLSRGRDVALFVGILIVNNLLISKDQADMCRKALLIFEKKVDTGELSKIKQYLIDDNLPPNDMRSYQYLSFLDTIKI